MGTERNALFALEMEECFMNFLNILSKLRPEVTTPFVDVSDMGECVFQVSCLLKLLPKEDVNYVKTEQAFDGLETESASIGYSGSSGH